MSDNPGISLRHKWIIVSIPIEGAGYKTFRACQICGCYFGEAPETCAGGKREKVREIVSVDDSNGMDYMAQAFVKTHYKKGMVEVLNVQITQEGK